MRMLVILASESKLMSTSELGRQMLVSPKYLRKLAGPLERAGLIHSVKGVYGGYRLSRGAAEISVLDLFAAFGEPIQIQGCQEGECCSLAENCLTRPLWLHLESILKEELRKATIEVLLRKGLSTEKTGRD